MGGLIPIKPIEFLVADLVVLHIGYIAVFFGDTVSSGAASFDVCIGGPLFLSCHVLPYQDVFLQACAVVLVVYVSLCNGASYGTSTLAGFPDSNCRMISVILQGQPIFL